MLRTHIITCVCRILGMHSILLEPTHAHSLTLTHKTHYMHLLPSTIDSSEGEMGSKH